MERLFIWLSDNRVISPSAIPKVFHNFLLSVNSHFFVDFTGSRKFHRYIELISNGRLLY